MAGYPRLSKETFLTVAEALKDALTIADALDDGSVVGVEIAANELADTFAERSSAFDRVLFLENCGIVDGEVKP